jgi:hypothetical protein
MAFKSANVTLATAITPLASSYTPACWLCIENTASNADIKVGDNTLTSAVYGRLVEDGPSSAFIIAPATGSGPLDLSQIYVLGTNTQVIHISWVAA